MELLSAGMLVAKIKANPLLALDCLRVRPINLQTLSLLARIPVLQVRALTPWL
jgi:hypothetical protein